VAAAGDSPSPISPSGETSRVESPLWAREEDDDLPRLELLEEEVDRDKSSNSPPLAPVEDLMEERRVPGVGSAVLLYWGVLDSA